MNVFLTAVLLSQLPPGPLDAFRANYASIKAKLDFEYTEGSFRAGDRRLWEGQVPQFVQNPALTVVGEWACDGRAEYFLFGSPEETLEKASKDKVKLERMKAFSNVLFIPKTELIWNDAFCCFHVENPHERRRPGGSVGWKIIEARPIELRTQFLPGGRGPFEWGGLVFPHLLKEYGPPQQPPRRLMRWGHPTEVEVYHKDEMGGKAWRQVEVSFDPAVGYVPRLVRWLTYFENRAMVDEVYLIQARPCAPGGFVPIEWYHISYEVADWRSRVPAYDEETDLKLPMPQVGASHFRATNFRELTGPVALTHLQGVHSVAGIGGSVPRPSTASSLDFEKVTALLGRKLTTPERTVLQNIDAAELRELDHPHSGAWIIYVLLPCLAAVALFLAVKRYRRLGRLASMVLCGLFSASGCGAVGDPVVKMVAAYKESVVFIEPGSRELSAALVVRNDGNRSVRVLKVDGGCSCREVDGSALPVAVRPGKSFVFPVRLSITPATMPQASQFALETDHGVISVSAPLLTLVAHQLHPEIIGTPYMYEADDWSFDITHRAIRPERESKSTVELRFPPEFLVSRGQPRSGKVGAAPGYVYDEDVYSLKLKDYSLGSHKAQAALMDSTGQRLLSAPIVWTRVPFISSVPDRVVIGSRPVRVFLRCPDESVELTRVITTPTGVKAVVSSPREFTVTLAEDASDVIDGTIEVGTSARSRDPLRVSLVRYQRTAASPGSKRPEP